MQTLLYDKPLLLVVVSFCIGKDGCSSDDSSDDSRNLLCERALKRRPSIVGLLASCTYLVFER